ncbi:MAG: hypothetical protein ACOH13_12715 [Flavobacteriales bacterium]
MLAKSCCLISAVTLEQINSIREAGDFISPDLSILSVSEVDGELCISISSNSGANDELDVYDFVPLQLAACSRSLPRSQDIPIEDNVGLRLGSLCLGSERSINPSSFTIHQYVAYLVDATSPEPVSDYRFEHDYVVIKKEHLRYYLEKMQHSAPLWGGFAHSSRHSVIPLGVSSTQVKMVAIPNICLPTPMHERLAMRSVSSATPSERYLQLYHQLELLFDWVIIQKIRAMSTDLLGVGKVLSAYASGDMDRLTSLLDNYLLSTDSTVKALGTLKEYEEEGENIFQKYGKAGNPLKDNWPLWIEYLRDGDPTEGRATNFKSLSIKDTLSHKKFIVRVTAYFIYRIRCCIAHSKIGEYVIRDTDEEFVVRFAEPLIRSVLKEVLSNQDILDYADGRLVPELTVPLTL